MVHEHGSLGQEVVTHDPSDPSIYVTQVAHDPWSSDPWYTLLRTKYAPIYNMCD